MFVLVIGGAFAYFQIIANNNATTKAISGQGELVGQVTLNTNITQLKLDLTENIMKKDNIGKIYYATAIVTESDVTFDCSYAYDISAPTTTTVNDSSKSSIIFFFRI